MLGQNKKSKGYYLDSDNKARCDEESLSKFLDFFDSAFHRHTTWGHTLCFLSGLIKDGELSRYETGTMRDGASNAVGLREHGVCLAQISDFNLAAYSATRHKFIAIGESRRRCYFEFNPVCSAQRFEQLYVAATVLAEIEIRALDYRSRSKRINDDLFKESFGCQSQQSPVCWVGEHPVNAQLRQ